MITRTWLFRLFIIFAALAVLFFTCSAVIFVKSYSDPRWRVFDFNSRQATGGEIYNVAEIPAVRSVRLVDDYTLRFEFTPPIKAASWSVRAQKGNRVVSQGKHPEIKFNGEPYTDTFDFIPEGVALAKDISIRVSFYPKEKYHEAGISWPDNYYSSWSSVPFSLKKPWSLDEWAGLPEDDPEMVEARRIIEGVVNMNRPSLERSEQVFRFVMDRIKSAGGTPSDEVQDASPLRTYTMLSTGQGKGWCENRALVYYLFANASGIKTRLVDVAGKFGPLKLTGHYFCESWDPDSHCWYLVDPMSSVAYVRTAGGRLLNTLEIKHLFDVDTFDGFTALTYDMETGTLVTKNIDTYYRGNKGYFRGDIVLAYKFGYPKNRSYCKLTHFLHYPTLLYAPFDLPGLYVVKVFFIWGFMVSLIAALLSGVCLLMIKQKTVAGL